MALGAPAVRIVARPPSRDQRRRELAAGDEADHEGADAKAPVHMQRDDRHRDADDEVCCKTIATSGSSATATGGAVGGWEEVMDIAAVE